MRACVCADVVIDGFGVEEEHCIVEFSVEHDEEEQCLIEVVKLHPIADACFVNGDTAENTVRLRQGNVVQLGQETVLRFNHPVEAQKLRALKAQRSMQNLADGSTPSSGSCTPQIGTASPMPLQAFAM